MKALHLLVRASLLVPLFGQAAPLQVDAARSSVGAVFKQMNVPVEANFRQFSVQIDYDAKRPGTAGMLANEVLIKFHVAASNR